MPARSRSATTCATARPSASTGCRSRSATTWSWSAAASAGSRRRGSTGRRDRDARILILDNHDDFGGHAKRNEFTLDGRLVIGYGGSESLQSPQSLYSPVAKGLLKALGVDVARFDTAFERELYPSLGLSRGVFFPREAFGQDKLVTGDPTRMVDDDLSRKLSNARPLREFIAEFPVSAQSKAQLLALFESTADPLAGKTAEEKIAILETHELPRLPDQGAAAAARRWRTASRAARSISSRSAATRWRRRTRATSAIRASAGSAFRRSTARSGTSPTSIISPTATPRSRGSWCAR